MKRIIQDELGVVKSKDGTEGLSKGTDTSFFDEVSVPGGDSGAGGFKLPNASHEA